jgi:hypothetical protein
MRDLTGAPSYDVEIEEEGLFEKLQKYDEWNYMMAASAGTSSSSTEMLEDLGLIA